MGLRGDYAVHQMDDWGPYPYEEDGYAEDGYPFEGDGYDDYENHGRLGAGAGYTSSAGYGATNGYTSSAGYGATNGGFSYNATEEGQVGYSEGEDDAEMEYDEGGDEEDEECMWAPGSPTGRQGTDLMAAKRARQSAHVNLKLD